MVEPQLLPLEANYITLSSPEEGLIYSVGAGVRVLHLRRPGTDAQYKGIHPQYLPFVCHK